MNNFKLVVLFLAIIFMSCGSNEKESYSSRGSVLDNIETRPDETIRDFINYLGNRDFQAAFKLSSVPAWGDYDKFSSNRYFGGIDFTEIKNIRNDGFEDGFAIVRTTAYYRDPVNSSATFKQKFYLKQFGDQWIIMKMKQEKL